MTRAEVRRRLALAWWQQLLATLAPLLVLNWLFGSGTESTSLLAMPMFFLGTASMFVSLPLFQRYKHALIATEKALGSHHEPAAWVALAQTRRLAMLAAALPAWIAALAVFAGLEAIALMLLALASLVLLYLYRIPRQLG